MSNGQDRPDAARVAARTRRAGKYRVDEKKYILSATNGRPRCPFCGSSQIEGSSIDVDAGNAHQEMSCTNCDSEWWDAYKLDSIFGLTFGEGPLRPAEKGYPMAEGK